MKTKRLFDLEKWISNECLFKQIQYYFNIRTGIRFLSRQFVRVCFFFCKIFDDQHFSIKIKTVLNRK